jgi:hypothetical protein
MNWNGTTFQDSLLSRHNSDQPGDSTSLKIDSPCVSSYWWKRIMFGLRVVRNKQSIPTGGSYKTALVMALKLFELAPRCARSCG